MVTQVISGAYAVFLACCCHARAARKTDHELAVAAGSPAETLLGA